MSTARWLRERFVEGEDSFGARSRARRWQVLLRHFPQLGEMTVVDLGGRADTWVSAPVRPREVVMLNLMEGGEALPPWATFVQGDACDPPADVLTRSYDLVFSNSLLEHVGGHARRRDLADVVHKLGERHWVQTPYRYFPLEPHYLFPGLQFLPLNVQARIVRTWPLLHSRPASAASALEIALDVELVGKTEMRYLFPGSELVLERLGPLTKSLVAVRTG